VGRIYRTPKPEIIRPTPKKRYRRRPRGFIDSWKPQGRQPLLDTVVGILKSYVAQLPLTIRQIFYILMGRFGFAQPRDGKEKPAQAKSRGYMRLVELLITARRARVIDMEAVRDDTFTRTYPADYADADDFIAGCAERARGPILDRQAGQKRRLVTWCEAAGMVPQLERICDPFGVEVMSNGGMDSLTAKHGMPREWAEAGVPIEVLHIGDLDKYGGIINGALEGDLKAFAAAYGLDLIFTQLAVTPEQVKKLKLLSDEHGNVQAEAIDPKELARIVREAIEQRMDMKVYRRVLKQEREVRHAVLQRLGVEEEE
jgi:hypothetical protein